MNDSHRESMRLGRQHEQAQARPLPHDKLVRHNARCPQARSCRSGWTWRWRPHAPHGGRPGRPPVFSNAAVQFCLVDQGAVQATAAADCRDVASLLRLAGLDWPVPTTSTLCRRRKTLKVQIPASPRADGPLNLLVDSTGIKFLGDGDLAGPQAWCSRVAANGARHLAMGTATSDIRCRVHTAGR